MDLIVTPARAAELLYGEEDAEAHAVIIRRQCVNGVIRNAQKVGRNWMINASREWPALFPQDARDPELAAQQQAQQESRGRREITADTTLGELLEMLLSGIAPAGTGA